MRLNLQSDPPAIRSIRCLQSYEKRLGSCYSFATLLLSHTKAHSQAPRVVPD
jgi:hypothetical protein